MPEFEGENQVAPYDVKVSYTARVAISGLAEEPLKYAGRILVVLGHRPEGLCVEPNRPGENEYTIGLSDCPGGALALRVNFDKQRRRVIVLDVEHPVHLRTYIPAE